MENTTTPTIQIQEQKEKYKALFLKPRQKKGKKKVAIMISEELNRKLRQITFIAGINKLRRGDLFENILEDHVTKNNSVVQELLDESLASIREASCEVSK